MFSCEPLCMFNWEQECTLLDRLLHPLSNPWLCTHHTWHMTHPQVACSDSKHQQPHPTGGWDNSHLRLNAQSCSGKQISFLFQTHSCKLVYHILQAHLILCYIFFYSSSNMSDVHRCLSQTYYRQTVLSRTKPAVNLCHITHSLCCWRTASLC